MRIPLASARGADKSIESPALLKGRRTFLLAALDQSIDEIKDWNNGSSGTRACHRCLLYSSGKEPVGRYPQSMELTGAGTVRFLQPLPRRLKPLIAFQLLSAEALQTLSSHAV